MQFEFFPISSLPDSARSGRSKYEYSVFVLVDIFFKKTLFGGRESFVGPLIHVLWFWTSGDVCPRFQNQSGSLAFWPARNGFGCLVLDCISHLTDLADRLW